MMLLKSIMAVLIIIQDVMGQEEHIWCYECGTGQQNQPDCLEFSLSSSWKLYWRKCQGDSICVKTIQGWDINDEIHAVRGCTPKKSAAGIYHQEGCWSHESTSTITCYCSNNLCNGAPGHRFVMPYALMAMSTLFLYLIYRS